MKTKIRNDIWFKRAASVISILYTIYVCVLSYRTLFYEVIITRRAAFCLYISAVTAIAVAAMIYSRKQLATKFASFILVPVLLPVILTCLGKWELIIPLSVCAVVIFLQAVQTKLQKLLSEQCIFCCISLRL